MLKIPCSKEEKKGLENCHKSQSFFNGINLMQAPGQEKSQTLSTSVADSQSRVRYFYMDIKYFYFQIHKQTIHSRLWFVLEFEINS